MMANGGSAYDSASCSLLECLMVNDSHKHDGEFQKYNNKWPGLTHTIMVLMVNNNHMTTMNIKDGEWSITISRIATSRVM